ncbi:MAG: type IV toxin-antitoxin system AbiEi family antitoxin domain-containing protein [Actinomycetes bacterium]
MGSAQTQGAQVVAQLSALAQSQGGVFTRAQAVAWGITIDELRAQVSAGRLRRLSPGVFFSARATPGVAGQRWAALLASGEGAVLSHWTAASVHGLSNRGEESRWVDVSIPAERQEVAVPFTRVRRSRLLPAKATVFDGWPITTAEDTVLDLVGEMRAAHDVIALLTDACRSKRVAPAQILDAMAVRKRQRHRQLVKDVVADIGVGVESTLEHKYLVRVERRHGLPKARRQVQGWANGVRTRKDLEYDEFDTVVELDGRLGHEGSGQHRDRLRDNASTRAGKATLRYGHADLQDPCSVAIEVADVLRARGWTGRPRPCGPICPVGKRHRGSSGG